MNKKIKNIVLDWGMVLAYPATGNWFITPRTRELIGDKNWKNAKLHFVRLKKAFEEAFIDITENHLLHTEEEEIIQFTKFFTEMIDKMNWNIPRELENKNGYSITENKEWGELLARDLVENPSHVLLYDDTVSLLKKMNENYNVYVLSDNWPSLTSKMKREKVDLLVEGTVISCDYGICKDNPRLFQAGVEEWSIDPTESIFADDNTVNLENARMEGFNSLWMKRPNLETKMTGNFPVVRNLQEIVDYCDAYNSNF